MTSPSKATPDIYTNSYQAYIILFEKMLGYHNINFDFLAYNDFFILQ